MANLVSVVLSFRSVERIMSASWEAEELKLNATPIPLNTFSNILLANSSVRLPIISSNSSGVLAQGLTKTREYSLRRLTCSVASAIRFTKSFWGVGT